MDRPRLEKKSAADTPLLDISPATAPAARASPPAQARHAQEGIVDPSAERDGNRSAWTRAAAAMNLPAEMQDVLGRYGFALALTALVLLVRGVLPLKEGTAIFQFPLVAVVLSAWYGGRGPGALASLVSAVGVLYWFIPPRFTFQLSPEYALGFFIFIAVSLFLSEFSAGRRRTGQALRASEERFRTFSDVAADVLMVHTEDGTLVDVNPQACESLGYTREELIGMKPADFDAGLDKTGLHRVIEQVESGEVVTFESQWRRRDGTTFPVEVRGRQFRRGDRWFGVSISRDITERKRAEAELRGRQEMLDLAQTAARVVAFDWHIGDRESENRWSPELEAMYGLEPGTFDRTFEGWKKLIHPDDWPAVKLALKHAHESGDVAAEYRVLYKNGSVHWLRAKGRMFLDTAGRPNRMVGFMLDVTDWRHAQEELRASEERFRTFADRATDAFFLMDEQVRVVDVNRQACESLGWSREELIGMHPRQFDMGLDELSIERLSERARSGEIITFETRHRRKDGSAFPVEIRSSTFKKGGELFYLAFARDISERKQAEERKAKLAAIVESSDDAIISKDLNGIITTWNTGAERIFGYAAWEVIGRSVTILGPPDRLDEVHGILERIRRGERVHHFETVRRRKDGTLLDVSLSVSPIIDESGKVVGASKVARDISERKRAEDALREKEDALEMARAELTRVSRLTTLGELTASIAHEVGQPLGAMVASAGASARWLAADPPAMAEARAALDNIVADGKRAREVIARIRALAKRQGPRKDWLDINQDIVEVLALMEHELRSHDIVLRTDLRRTLPRVAGDRIQLQQVLLNLIVNAVEAMSAVNDRSRELAIVSRLDNPDAVLVEVRDSGSGLDPQAAEQVFEALYTTKAEGIGIGLSISRSIIEAHGGRLWASPNEPHGAIFRFSLPIAQKAAA
jgi:PAS domain S-box-containing protein